LTRRALQAIYTLAFICLLRSDEVLKIRRDHIELVKEDHDDDTQYMVLTLPFRKTHQDGRTFSHFKSFLELFPMLNIILDVQPFYIYPLDEAEAHLCPVRAMAQWIKASKVTSGFLFRKFTAQDRPSAHEDAAMVSLDHTHTSMRLVIGQITCRLQKSSLSYSATICSISVWIPSPMELIPSVAAVVNILHQTGAGHCVQFVSGGDGARNSPT
jgi:hypothetical protein